MPKKRREADAPSSVKEINNLGRKEKKQEKKLGCLTDTLLAVINIAPALTHLSGICTSSSETSPNTLKVHLFTDHVVDDPVPGSIELTYLSGAIESQNVSQCEIISPPIISPPISSTSSDLEDGQEPVCRITVLHLATGVVHGRVCVQPRFELQELCLELCVKC